MVKRRILRQQHCVRDAEGVVASLNGLYGSGDESGLAEMTLHATLSQRVCIHHVCEAIHDLGEPPPDMDPQGALRSLLGPQDYAGIPAHLAPLELDLVALPDEDVQPIDVSSVGNGFGRKLQERVSSKMLPEDLAKEKMKDTAPKRPYNDPTFRQRPHLYAQFLKNLRKRHVIVWKRQRKCSVGAFFVWKKNGQQRLVIDARRPNALFEPPDSVNLATGQTFGSITVDKGEAIYLGQTDIEVAFY